MSFSRAEFVDIHSHILPGLDDGPADLAGSLAMAAAFLQGGVRRVVATPHFLPGTAWAPSRDKILATLATLRAALEKAGLELAVVAGMEIAYHTKLTERIRSGAVLPLGDSDTYLIEPSFQGEQEGLLATLESLLDQGTGLILAHPERVEAFQRMPQSLMPLVQRGLRLQINAGSLLGAFGPQCLACAEELWRRGCIHFIASDAHDQSKRAPLSAAAWQRLLAAPGGEALLATVNTNIAGLFPEETLSNQVEYNAKK